MPRHLPLERQHLLDPLRLIQHHLLIYVHLRVLIRRHCEVVLIRVIRTDHPMYDQRVLLVTVFEEDVQVFVKIEIQPRDLEGILEISEIVIFIESHS